MKTTKTLPAREATIDWLPPKKPDVIWKTPPHPAWCHCTRCDEQPDTVQDSPSE